MNKRRTMDPEPAADDTTIHVGTRLRERRRALDLSLEQVAEHIGVSTSTVHNYEQGVYRQPANMLAAFARLYKVEVGTFFASD